MRIRFFLEYALVRLVELMLWPLSWEAAQALGAAIGGWAKGLLRRRWRLTLRNLELAFPEMTAAEREAVALEAWRNAGRFGVELVKTRHLSREELRDLGPVEGLDNLRAAMAEGKGVLINAGHQMNFEVVGQALGAAGLPLAIVGRAMRNPRVGAWLLETRQRTGATVLSHKNPFFPSVRWLKGGGLLAILIDHNIRVGGVFVPFFGRPAATSTLTGLLAVKLGCPVLSVRIRREGRRFVTTFGDLRRADPAASADKEIERLTREFVGILEGYVRQRPAEWLWGHDRWRRSGQAEAPAETRAAAGGSL